MTLAQRTLAEVEIQRARRTDPATSKLAATQAHGLAAVHRLLILQTMRDDAGRDWNASELAAACGLTPEQVGRRIAELVRDGEAEYSGASRPSSSDRPSRCIKAVARG